MTLTLSLSQHELANARVVDLRKGEGDGTPRTLSLSLAEGSGEGGNENTSYSRVTSN